MFHQALCSFRKLLELRNHARIQEFSSGGGPGQSDKKSSDKVFFFFFLVLSLFFRSQMVNFKEIYHSFKVPEGVQHIPGGVQLFPGGSNCLFPIETHITCDFPGGGGGQDPPCLPLWIRTWKQYHKSASKTGRRGKMTSFLPVIGMVVSILA